MEKYYMNYQLPQQRRTFSPLDIIIRTLTEQGKRISELEERLKETHSQPSIVQVPVPMQVPQHTSFLDHLRQLVDPICIVCGAEYWSYNHEHGLCPKCAQRYPRLL